MPKSITQYRVFIASPGGLEAERECFRKRLEKCSRSHGEQHEVQFHPVGWEDTLSGAGRPQEQINEDLRQCDYAVFVLHDRWGSPTGNGHTSGTEEEWNLAEQLYAERKIRNIVLCFKNIDPSRLSDPGEQLKAVLVFKQKIESERRYFFSAFQETSDFGDLIDTHLARWLKDHLSPSKILAAEPLVPVERALTSEAPDPHLSAFAFWLGEAHQIRTDGPLDDASRLFCATKAQAAASTDGEWAAATHMRGLALYGLDKVEEALEAFIDIDNRLKDAAAQDMRESRARALYNKGVMFGALDRGAEEIAAYDDIIVCFAKDPAPALRELVARALINKGFRLGALDRSVEGIAAYDDLIERFADDPTPALREQVAKALFSKGITLGELDRGAAEIAVYDDLIVRFAADPAPALREQIAQALFNKGARLGALDCGAEEIAAYDDLINRFADDPSPALREAIARALVGKGGRLGALDRGTEEIAAYDDLIARFADDPNPRLRKQVANALFNKGVALGELDRGTEAIAAYDDLIARFADDPAPDIQEIVSETKTARDALRKS